MTFSDTENLGDSTGMSTFQTGSMAVSNVTTRHMTYG